MQKIQEPGIGITLCTGCSALKVKRPVNTIECHGVHTSVRLFDRADAEVQAIANNHGRVRFKRQPG